MLELLGAGYVIEECIASYNKRQKDELFRIYVTDGLFALVNKSMSYERRYIHLVGEMEHKTKETKPQTAKDVKARIKAKIRGGNAT